MRITALKILLVVVCLLLIYRIFSIYPGIVATVYTQNLNKTSHLSSVKAQPDHAWSWQQLAAANTREQHSEVAILDANKALFHNPSDGFAAALLGSHYLARGNKALAEQANQLAWKLWPSHTSAMLYVADYSAKTGNLKRAVKAWDISLRQNMLTKWGTENQYQRHIFPVLAEIMQQPETSRLLSPFFQKPPPWWDQFFEWLSHHSENRGLLKAFYEQSIARGNRFAPEHRKVYFQRLIRDGLWDEAYHLWLSGLSPDEVRRAKAVYDGGFETSRYNDDGYAWKLASKSHIQVYKDKISKAEGDASLKISFTNWVDDYWNYISQLIFLAPGDYQLRYQAKANLSGHKGMRWTLSCVKSEKYLLDPDAKLIAHTTPLKGAFDWSTFENRFTVPDSGECKAQLLALGHAGSNAQENKVRGDLWLDHVRIEPLEE